MEEQAVKQQMQELIAQINYHNQKYYVEDAPEIDDYEYDMLYRQLQQLENDHPEWIQPDSPTQRVGGAPLNTFEKVEHEVPMESLHDSFSEEELMDFDRRVREVVSDRALDGIDLRALGSFFDYYLTFAISAEVGVLIRWLEGGMRESVGTMARLMTALMFVRPGDLYGSHIEFDIPSFALATLSPKEERNDR